MKKGAPENSQNSRGNTIGLQNFRKHLFYRTPLEDCFCFFCAMLLKWGTANNVWKNSDEYSLPKNTNLRRTNVQVYHFCLDSRNFSFGLHCLLPEKQPSEKRCSVKKGVLEDFINFIRKYMLESLFNKVAGLMPILKNICQWMLLHCTRTTHCYLSVLLYIQHLPHRQRSYIYLVQMMLKCEFWKKKVLL